MICPLQANLIRTKRLYSILHRVENGTSTRRDAITLARELGIDFRAKTHENAPQRPIGPNTLTLKRPPAGS